MSSVVLKRLIGLYNQSDKATIDKKNFDKSYQSIKESFHGLVFNNFIERLPQLESFYHDNLLKNGSSNENGNHDKNGHTQNNSKIPIFVQNDLNLKDIPDLKIDCKTPNIFLLAF